MEVHPATTKERIILDGQDFADLVFHRKVENEDLVIEVTEKGFIEVISNLQ